MTTFELFVFSGGVFWLLMFYWEIGKRTKSQERTADAYFIAAEALKVIAASMKAAEERTAEDQRGRKSVIR